MAAREFEKTELNTVGRLKDRARYDFATIQSIVQEAKVGHVAFVDDVGRPQCVPMLAALEEREDGDLFLYLHGYGGARFVKQMADPGTPVVTTFTLIDGFILALSHFNHSMNYRSAVLHGVTLPFSEDELREGAKSHAFKCVVESATPGRWENARQPSPAEDKTTGVIRIRVETASAKVRAKGVGDDAKDLQDEELVGRVWTGVVPVKLARGAPEPTPYNKLQVPQHVLDL
ncbi:hypothetical protein BKA62DRAFT_716139 [Auriculariales sp. MPI-PUGE-AT-0066]|nr:hypothetical protein BKA62DRAFT_716139 [Auriculariales sp. MPI-PUGE-AT-0066]